jgi:hypothetical protein
VLNGKALWAQGSAVAGQPDPAFSRINPQHMITPDQAWDWNMFKAQGGPTYAGSAGWKRFTDFLISKVQEFGAVDLDYIVRRSRFASAKLNAAHEGSSKRPVTMRHQKGAAGSFPNGSIA